MGTRIHSDINLQKEGVNQELYARACGPSLFMFEAESAFAQAQTQNLQQLKAVTYIWQ
jgi:hypothetical protein